MAISLSGDRGFQAFWRGFSVDLCPGLGDLRAEGRKFLQYHVPKKPHDGITGSDRHSKEPNSLAAKHWIELMKLAAVAKLPDLKLKIPGGKKE